MANEHNLKRFSSSEARENGKKGAKKSAEVRRARKTLKEELLLLLSEDNEQTAMCVAMLKQAKKGNVKAFGIIRDTIGEMPTQKQEITGANGEPIGIQKVFVTPDEVKEVKAHINNMING